MINRVPPRNTAGWLRSQLVTGRRIRQVGNGIEARQGAHPTHKEK